MLKKTIEYTDYEGNKRKSDYYFALSKAEVIKWLTSTGEYTLDKAVKTISAERNMGKLVELLDDLIHRSYGVKSLDGNNFIKNETEWTKFSQSPAYDVIFMELIGDSKKAADFFNGVIPQDLAAEVEKMMKENPENFTEYKEVMNDTKVLTTVQ